MPLGPGKYDDLCTYVMEQAKAQGAIVIVFGGTQGSGFAVQATLGTHLTIPDLLETIAAEMRASMEKGQL